MIDKNELIITIAHMLDVPFNIVGGPSYHSKKTAKRVIESLDGLGYTIIRTSDLPSSPEP
jgi:hypothetical protein